MTTLPNPRTAMEASRQANTNERALAIIAEGYSFFADTDLEMIAVCKPGDLHPSYWLSLDGQNCDCPDFANRKDYCKHTLAYNIVAANNIPTIASTNRETVREFCNRRDSEMASTAAQEAFLAQMDSDAENSEAGVPW